MSTVPPPSSSLSCFPDIRVASSVALSSVFSRFYFFSLSSLSRCTLSLMHPASWGISHTTFNYTSNLDYLCTPHPLYLPILSNILAIASRFNTHQWSLHTTSRGHSVRMPCVAHFCMPTEATSLTRHRTMSSVRSLRVPSISASVLCLA